MSRFGRGAVPASVVPVPATPGPGDGAEPAFIMAYLTAISHDGAVVACSGLAGRVDVSFRTPAGRVEISGQVTDSTAGATQVHFDRLSHEQRCRIDVLTRSTRQAAIA